MNSGLLLEVTVKIERYKILSIAEKAWTWFRQWFRYALWGMGQNPASGLEVVTMSLPSVIHNPLRA